LKLCNARLIERISEKSTGMLGQVGLIHRHKQMCVSGQWQHDP